MAITTAYPSGMRMRIVSGAAPTAARSGPRRAIPPSACIRSAEASIAASMARSSSSEGSVGIIARSRRVALPSATRW